MAKNNGIEYEYFQKLEEMEKEEGILLSGQEFLEDWVIVKRYGIQALNEDSKTIEALIIIDEALAVIKKYCRRGEHGG